MVTELVLLGAGAAVGAAGVVGKEGVKVAADIIRAALIPAAQQLGEELRVEVRQYFEERARLATETVLTATELLNASGIPAVPVPGRTLWPLLNAAANECEPDLQRKWAVLLANAADPRRQNEVMPSFVSILSQLSPTEALLLERVYLKSIDGLDRVAYRLGREPLDLRDTALFSGPDPDSLREIEMPYGSYLALCDNLARLGVVEEVFAGPTTSGLSVSNKRYGALNLTELGRRFVAACVTPPTPPTT
jgi:hypothetical protein